MLPPCHLGAAAADLRERFAECAKRMPLQIAKSAKRIQGKAESLRKSFVTDGKINHDLNVVTKMAYVFRKTLRRFSVVGLH